MPEPTTPPTPDYTTLTKQQLFEELLKRDRDVAAAVAHLAELRDLRDRVEREKELAVAREKERAAAKEAKEKGGGIGRLLGTIPVYLTDDPADVIERAKALMAGQIPPDKATRFRIEAHLRIKADSPLAKRLGTREPPLGTEFGVEEMSHDDRMHYVAQGAIVPIG